MSWNPFKFRRHRRRLPIRKNQFAVEALESRLAPSVSMLTYHVDNFSSGANLNETCLPLRNACHFTLARYHGRKPANAWVARTAISPSERARFHLAVDRQRFASRVAKALPWRSH